MFALPPFVSREKNGVHGITIGFSGSFYPQYGWMDGRGVSCLGAQLYLLWRKRGQDPRPRINTVLSVLWEFLPLLSPLFMKLVNTDWIFNGRSTEFTTKPSLISISSFEPRSVVISIYRETGVAHELRKLIADAQNYGQENGIHHCLRVHAIM